MTIWIKVFCFEPEGFIRVIEKPIQEKLSQDEEPFKSAKLRWHPVKTESVTSPVLIEVTTNEEGERLAGRLWRILKLEMKLDIAIHVQDPHGHIHIR